MGADSFFRWIKNLLARRLENFCKKPSGRKCFSNSRNPGVGKILELPRKTVRWKLGCHVLVRVRWGIVVQFPSNPHRAARPRKRAERGVCSGHGHWPPAVFFAQLRSVAEMGAFSVWSENILVAGLSSPVGLVFYASTHPLHGKYAILFELHIQTKLVKN